MVDLTSSTTSEHHHPPQLQSIEQVPSFKGAVIVKHSSSTNDECSFPSFQDFGTNYLPSDDTICKCFLSKFIEEECAYISEIQFIHPGEVKPCTDIASLCSITTHWPGMPFMV